MHHYHLVKAAGNWSDPDPESVLYYLEVVSQAAYEPMLWLAAKSVVESRSFASQLRASQSATIASIMHTQRAIADSQEALTKMQERAINRSLHWSLIRAGH
ncbi:hypothetical protein ALP50_01635 [Pseudomonas syringae pv. spinaceae]|uniref:Uncharacterized protein n=1 Tax=Pseudomonas syringae pv. spinaceae TaxID=264459 RepID=A0A0P9ZEL3_PSESX|nr:hypothetical protein [Pseudomonas syringae]KPY59913.1 Unknown protein sequence [Pseudomonas syringae pv. spinaceae]RMT29680.1 hypothetical protein ALP50_01635 [Pseudomonas syringae pv. spinaceae]